MPGISGKQLAGDFIDFINGVFKTRLTGIATANNTVNLPIGSGRLLLDTDPIGSIGAGVSVRGYLPIVIVPTSKTLALSDANTSQICTAASTITIPLNATVEYPIGTQILIQRNTSAAVTIAFIGGVTVVDEFGSAISSTAVSNATMLRKIATNTWIATNPIPNNAFLPGSPTTTTQPAGTSNTTIATTAHVQNAVAIAGSMVNPSGVSVVDFAIPAGVRRLTLLSNGLQVTSGVIVRLGTSSGVLTSGYNGVMHYIGPSANYPFAGGGASSTAGFSIPQCGGGGVDSFCMTFYRISPNTWNAAGQSKDSDYCNIASGNILLPGELTTFSYINPTTMTSGSLQLLWEF